MPVLKPSQLEQLTRQLNENREALLGEVREELENSGDQHRIALLNDEPGDFGDESLANGLADFNVARFHRQIQELRDIDAALRRIRDDEYGVCIECGNDIGFSRLQAYPTAKRCIVCQEQHERTYAQDGNAKL
jgi:RNA polymerase-binding protein DksA